MSEGKVYRSMAEFERDHPPPECKQCLHATQGGPDHWSFCPFCGRRLPTEDEGSRALQGFRESCRALEPETEE